MFKKGKRRIRKQGDQQWKKEGGRREMEEMRWRVRKGKKVSERD